MSRTRKALFILLAVLVAVVAALVVPTVWLKPWRINDFYTRVFVQYALRRPMLLSELRILEGAGIRFHNARLNDFSLRFQHEEQRWATRQLRILRSYDRERLDEAGRLSFDILEWFLADYVEGCRFAGHYYPVSQRSGIQIALPDFMVNSHRISDLRGARQYLRRVSRFGRAFDQTLDAVRLQAQEGIVPPLFVIRYVLEGMNRFISVPPSQNVLYTHLEEELGQLEDLRDRARQKLLRRLEGEIQTVVYPAYTRLIDQFTRLQAVATNEEGAWKLPDGEAFYAYTLRHHTTTGMSADQIHELGLREVARIHAEMRSILAAEGYPVDDLAGAMNRLNREERFLYPDTPEGREKILRDFQQIIDEMEAGTSNFLDLRPAVGVRVKPVPEFKQAKAPGAYYDRPPLDMSEPGTLFVNLRDVREIPKFGMRTLAYHETVPGHHFQGSIAEGLVDLPIFRRIVPFTAYGEGWALYAERLAAEQGYEQDPYDRLGYLTSEVLRAARLVVDTGIHARRWSRERAIDYMLANTGMPRMEIVAEVERYIADPGQACAYMVGALKILELRQRAMERQGPDFDLKEFHNRVLADGAMPLSILEELVERQVGRDREER